MYLSRKVTVWLFVNALIIILDGFFASHRPDTLKGGKYYWFYAPYELYYRFDKLYDMNDDNFVVIQGWLSMLEGVLTLISLIVALSSSKVQQLVGTLLLICVHTMTFWKTVIFLWYDSYWTTEDVHNFTLEAILYYHILSAAWIVLPFLSIWSMIWSIAREQKEKLKKD